MKPLTFLFFFLFHTVLIAQQKGEAIDVVAAGKEYLKTQIKQIDEFIGLFNNTTIQKQQLIDIADGSITEDVQVFGQKSSNTQLSFYDDDWYAVLECKVIFQNKVHPIEMVLQVKDYEPDKRAKWVITGIKAPFLDLQAECADASTLIPPSANEVNFISLSRVMADKENIIAYTDDDYQTDNLSVFLFLVKNGMLTMTKGGVGELSYYFAQVPDHIVRVAYRNRADYKSGWLISELIQVKDTEKKEYIKKYIGTNGF